MKPARANTRDNKADAASPMPDAAAYDRFPRLLGLLAGLILIAFFIYATYPLQAIMLTAITLAAVVILSAWLVRQSFLPSGLQPPASGLFLSALGSLPALGALAFVLWALIRWHFAEVPELVREWIVGLLAMAVALVLGCGVGALAKTETAESSAMLAFFRLAALAALGFGLYAFHQYFVSYPRSFADLSAETAGAVRDLNTQSLLHALRERRVGGTLGNPNLFAAQLSVFALLSLASLRDPRRLWRWLGAAGAAAALAATLLSRSRGGALTMLLALVMGGIMLAVGRNSKWPLPPGPRTCLNLPRKIVLVLVLVIVIDSDRVFSSIHSNPPPEVGGIPASITSTITSTSTNNPLMQRLGNVSTIRERLFYWQIALKVWARHPFIGEGPGGFQLLYLTLKSPVARESQFAHSWLFQVGSELGLVGLGLLTLFFAGTAARAFAAWRRGSLHPHAPWCLAALLLLAFNGLFEFSLQWHAFLTAAGLLGGLAIALGSGVPPHSAIRNPQSASKEERAGTPALPGQSAYRIPHSAFLGLFLALASAILTLAVAPPFFLAEQATWQAELAARDEPPRWSEAAAAYGRAVRWLPRHPGLRLSWAAALERSASPEKAWMQLAEAQRLNPRSAAVRAAQAESLERWGQLKPAIAKLGEALERYPSHVGYRLERARLALAAGDAAAARRDLTHIEQNRLPVWEFQQPEYLKLRARAGLPPVSDIPS